MSNPADASLLSGSPRPSGASCAAGSPRPSDAPRPRTLPWMKYTAEALSHWGLGNAATRPLSLSENATYLVETPGHRADTSCACIAPAIAKNRGFAASLLGSTTLPAKATSKSQARFQHAAEIRSARSPTQKALRNAPCSSNILKERSLRKPAWQLRWKG